MRRFALVQGPRHCEQTDAFWQTRRAVMSPNPSMSPESIVQEARRLLDHGQGLEARELLLRKGFIKALQPEIQAAFMSLIPPSPTLRKMLDGPYRDLQSETAATRLRGLIHIAREIASDSPLDGVRWMRHPRASQPLIERLSDTDQEVAAQALLVLTRLVWRYFPDQRARAALLPLLSSPDQERRLSAIGALAWLRSEESVEPLAPLLAEGTDQDRLAVAASLASVLNENQSSLQQTPLQLSAPGRQRWRQRLRAAAQDPSEPVRSSAHTALEAGQLKAPPGKT
jgi:hypothetical protein